MRLEGGRIGHFRSTAYLKEPFFQGVMIPWIQLSGLGLRMKKETKKSRFMKFKIPKGWNMNNSGCNPGKEKRSPNRQAVEQNKYHGDLFNAP